jgi:predicted acetyltransferase
MDIEIQSAQARDKSILRNLMELYVYDFSEFTDWDVDEHGLFGYKYLDHYWTDSSRHPFFITISRKLAGFVLVRIIDPSNHERNYSIAEFFVLRKYRRQGVGQAVAHRIFDMFPGQWSVSQIEANYPAQIFWRKVISEYTGGEFEEEHLDEHGSKHLVQRFRAKDTGKER